ncbi:MAG: hypothetical protein ACR2GI_04060 [Thermomicrobiales bacterium]
MSEQRMVSRRTALAGLGGGGLGLAFASHLTGATASSHSAALADHPLTGVWMAIVTLPTAPGVPIAVPSIYTADGSVLLAFPPSEAGPQGVVLKSAAVGVWEALDERTGYFTAVLMRSDVDGSYLGSVTIEGRPSVSEDGQTFEDGNPENVTTIRDASNAVVAAIPGGSPEPVRGIRMGPGNPGFPEAPGEATPLS